MSLWYSMLWRPLPYKQPESLFAVWRSGGSERSLISPWLVRYLRNRLSIMAEVAALRSGATTDDYSLQLPTEGVASRLQVTGVTTNYFEVLGEPAALGRTFEEQDGDPGADRVILLSDRCWRLYFHGDRSVIGQAVVARDKTGSHSYRVIGVMQAKFRMLYTLPTVDRDEDTYVDDAWVPIRLSNTEWDNQARVWAQMLLRVRDGESADRVRVRLASAIASSPTPLTRPSSGQSVVMVPLRDDLTHEAAGQLRTAAAIAISLTIFLVATAASMVAAQLFQRRRELSILVFLGASDRSVLNMLWLEIAALATLATGLAIAIAQVLVTLIDGSLPLRTPRALESLSSGPLILAISIPGALVLVVLLLQVAWQLRKVGFLRTTGIGGWMAHRRQAWAVRRWLLGLQLASATALLVCALIVTHSAVNLTRVRVGFHPTGLFAVTLQPIGSLYSDDLSRGALQTRLAAELRAHFAAAAMTDSPPILGISYRQEFILDDQHGSLAGLAEAVAVTDSYFATIGQAVVSGRSFSDSLGASDSNSAIVNESWALRYLPGISPIGASVMFGGQVWRRIVAVVEDARSARLGAIAVPTIYIPLHGGIRGPITILARSSSVRKATTDLREAVRFAAADVPLSPISDMREVVDRTAIDTFIVSRLLVATSLLSVSLTMFAASSLVAAIACDSRRDLAICIALGASLRDVRLRVMRQLGLPIIVGLLIGASLAVSASGIMQALLYEVDVVDAQSFALGVLTMAIVVACAGCLPLLRLSEASVVRDLRE